MQRVLVVLAGLALVMLCTACPDQEVSSASGGGVITLPANPTPEQAKEVYDKLEEEKAFVEGKLEDAQDEGNQAKAKKWRKVLAKIKTGKDYYAGFLPADHDEENVGRGLESNG